MKNLANLHNTNPKLLSHDHVVYQDEIPTGDQIKDYLGPKKTFLIYDQNIPLQQKVLKSYDYVLKVEAGEGCKTLHTYKRILQQLMKYNLSARQLVLVAMGGGSLGDAVGFVASTYKRGCLLVHIPSTWLAAVDSSHGGKTALNFSKAKNQIGSFYFANIIIVSKKILLKQPAKLFKSALGEVAKTYLYDRRVESKIKTKITSGAELYKHLPSIIEAKYRIVKKDPFELKKVRKVLNLGHTIGHVLEAYYKLPHGEAIKYGLSFTIQWSLEKNYISPDTYKQIKQNIKKYFLIDIQKTLNPMPKKHFLSLLKKDKKAVSTSHIDFVFLHDKTTTKVMPVTHKDILTEAQNQGWVQ